MLALVSFVFVLGVLIFFHELGHFLVAKKVGIGVERFSLFFPPNIVSRKIGETTYCIGSIPLGGYVKMVGENPDDETVGASNEFTSKPFLSRAAVLIAGPFMNYILAVGLLTGIYYFVGIPYYSPDRVVIGEVSQDSPASRAGLQQDDQIIAVNGQPITGFESMRNVIKEVIEKPVQVTWVRGMDTLSTGIVTRKGESIDEKGNPVAVGEIGVSQKSSGYQEFGLVESISNGFITTNVIVWETLKFLKQLLSFQVSAKMIGGPLFIAQQSGKEARRGLPWLLFFMAQVSANLAVLNIQPIIPILDGGQLLFLIIEKIRGAPLSIKARIAAQYFGILAVLSLILVVTYNDILRLVAGN
jgi:regulator of sigma E protease